MIGVSAGYVTYAVKSFMHLPRYSSRGALVRRRFRDFVVRRIQHMGLVLLSVHSDATCINKVLV